MATKQIRFGGLDNQHDPQEVGDSGCVVAANIDHRNDMSIRRRQGYTTTDTTGTALHSLWAPEGGAYGYVIDGNQLIYLDTSLAKTQVLTMPSSNGAVYVEAGGIVAVINASGTRFAIADTQFVPTAPATLDGETSFVGAMSSIGGSAGAYYNGRLYIAGAGLRFSRPYDIGFYDTRDYLIPFDFEDVEVFAVDDGLWVGGVNRSVFLRGDGPDKFTYSYVADFGIYSGAKVQPQRWGVQIPGTAYVAATTRGTMVLSSGGQYSNVGKDMYHPPIGYGHRSIIRKENGYEQLLTCFTYTGASDTFTNKQLNVDHLDI